MPLCRGRFDKQSGGNTQSGRPQIRTRMAINCDKIEKKLSPSKFPIMFTLIYTTEYRYTSPRAASLSCFIPSFLLGISKRAHAKLTNNEIYNHFGLTSLESRDLSLIFHIHAAEATIFYKQTISG